MNFPDFESLKRRAEQRQFRQPLEAETEAEFRTAFADFMVTVDRVESGEIRAGSEFHVMGPGDKLKAMGIDFSDLLRS